MRPATVEKAVCVHEEQNRKDLYIRVAKITTKGKMVTVLMMTSRRYLFIRKAVQPWRVISSEATDVLLLNSFKSKSISLDIFGL